MPDAPAHKLGLDLDELEEDGAVRAPYDFKFGGETFTAYDPDRLDWKIVAALDNDDAREVLQAFLEPKDFTRFLLLDPAPTTWKIKRLIGALQQHFYGPATPGE